MVSSQKTILVLEDELSLNRAISKKLELSGYSVISAGSVEEGLKLIENNKIDAAWVDHYLRGHKSGVDFVMKLKEKDETRNLPEFIVSNTASDEKVRSYIRLVINKYFVKANHSLNEIIGDINGTLKLGVKE